MKTQIHPSRYPSMSTPTLVPPLPFTWKIGLLFKPFQRFLVKIRARSKVEGLELKSNIVYTGSTNPGILNMQNIWSHHFPILSLLVTKVVFFNFNPLFQVDCFSWYHTHLIGKNTFDFLNENLILNWLAQIWKPKNLNQKSLCGLFYLPYFI